MKVGFFDLESTALNADDGILLCAAIKTYGACKGSVKTFRADEYKTWKTDKTDQKEMVIDIMNALEEYDILVAHNGQYFDKPMLNTYCLKYGLRPHLRGKKFIDPMWLAKKHLRLHRNSQHNLIKFLGLRTQKTHVDFEHWLRAALNGDKRSMNYIVEHCRRDILSMEEVYDRVRTLVKRVDDGGSAY